MKRLLLGVIGLAVLGVVGWQWWLAGATTVNVTGEATVKAAPDEYVFYPSYQERATSKDEARTKVTDVGNGVVSKLKELGVSETQLTSNVTVGEDYSYAPTPEPPKERGFTGSYSLTMTLDSFELAKKVQEYLATTPVVGSVTPTSTFADATQKRLEREARQLALEDAKAQAEETAETLGVKILKIESIGEPQWGGAIPFAAKEGLATAGRPDATVSSSPDLLVGEQEVTYAIQVVYRVR